MVTLSLQHKTCCRLLNDYSDVENYGLKDFSRVEQSGVVELMRDWSQET